MYMYFKIWVSNLKFEKVVDWLEIGRNNISDLRFDMKLSRTTFAFNKYKNHMPMLYALIIIVYIIALYEKNYVWYGASDHMNCWGAIKFV